MRRPTTLAVDTTNELAYELNISPRTSIDSHSTTTDLKHATTPAPPQPAQPTLTPSIRVLFSHISRKHFLCLIVPAIFSSFIAGGIAPFMTFVVGQAFDTFAQFSLTPIHHKLPRMLSSTVLLPSSSSGWRSAPWP